MTATATRRDQHFLEALQTSASAPSFCATMADGECLDLDTKVYFPIDAIVSLRVQSHGRSIHLAFAGVGDVIGAHGCLISHFPKLTAIVMRRGRCFETARDDYRRCLQQDRNHSGLMARYVAATSATYLTRCADALNMGLECRVARWLVDFARLARVDDIHITHSDLAVDLGVQRSGVTTALHLLEEKGLIKSTRARIQLTDAVGLALFATSSVPMRQEIHPELTSSLRRADL